MPEAVTVAGRHRAPRQGLSYAAPLRLPEYRGLLVAYVTSLVGDQLARLALAVLVFQRSGSSALTAASYAVTYLPWLVAGPALAGLGDRLPRRTVLLATDLTRAALAAMMALPDVPLPALLVLAVLLTVAQPPFEAARSALLPEVLPTEATYAAGHALQSTAMTLAGLFGFGVGGAVVAAVGARPALAVDAASFVVSAAVVRLTVRRRPPAERRHASAGPARTRPRRAGPSGLQVVLAERRAAYVLVLASTVALFDVVALALAVPWAAEMGGGSTAAGVLSAACPLGAALGGLLVLRRLSAEGRRRALPILALLALAPQTLALLHPGLVVAALLLAVAGVGTVCQVVANQAFVLAVPAEHRAKAFGVAGACLMSVKGLGALLAGVAADLVPPSTVVGTASVFGLGAVGLLVARAPARAAAVAVPAVPAVPALPTVSAAAVTAVVEQPGPAVPVPASTPSEDRTEVLLDLVALERTPISA